MSRERPTLRWASAASALAALLACGPREEPGALRNVVLISIDTLRADRLNCYGYRTREVSPEIDRLAAEGIFFEKHITASPWTTPAHISLFTSLSPAAHGVIGYFGEFWDKLDEGAEYDRLAEEHETLAEVLARHGYVTAAFTGGLTMDPRIGFDQGFASYDTSMAKLSAPSFASLTAWIEAHRDRPFFVFWHTFELHAPYLETRFLADVLAPEDADRLERSLARLRNIPGTPLAGKKGRKVLMRHRSHTREVCSALYDGCVRSVDGWIGRLMEVLKGARLYDRTLVIVTSDHGEQLGEKAGVGGSLSRDGRFYNAHGHTMYEEMLRIPLIVKLPHQRHAGRRVAAVSRLIDVMPTILDVLEVDADLGKMQGASLRPLWEGDGPDLRQAFSEALAARYESKSLRSDRYKYVLSVDRGQVERHGRAFVPDEPAKVELYDLRVDPGEQRNLLPDSDPEIRKLAARFDRDLRRVAGERRGEAARVHIGPEMLERLEALGYVE